MKIGVILVIVLVTLVLFIWLGLKIKPAPFPAYPHKQPELETVPLPEGLPAPVERYFRQQYGERIPLIDTCVISGRGWLRAAGLRLPMRFRFTHEAGQNYRHYFEVTFFGLPVLKINEAYVDEKERMEFPWGVMENNPKLDQGGVLGMWAESIEWLPAILATDPRVRWEAIDADSAFFIVPFGAQEERVLVRFNPASGKIQYWEMMRFQNGQGEKVLWINGTWFDDGRPWILFETEEILNNVAVDVRAKGLGK